MLHKASKLLGYHIHAKDGQIGHVDDFLLDEHWNVRYLVVDTSNWIGGKSVVISPQTLDQIDSPDREVHVQMTREQIEHSPRIDAVEIDLTETLPPLFIM